MDFYVPSYLDDDFSDILLVLGEDCIANSNSATPTLFKALVQSLDFKSNMKGLSDNTKEIVFSKSINLIKGDYITDSYNNTYLLNWSPYRDINSQRTQMQICTCNFNFQRWAYEIFDSEGVSCTPAGYIDIAMNIDGFITRINSKNWLSSDGMIGIEPSQNIMICIQFNEYTRNIAYTDEFHYVNTQYLITDIDYTQLNHGSNDGILVLYAKMMDGDKHA